jgi:hypothetical protein
MSNINLSNFYNNWTLPAGLEGRQYNYTLSCIISSTSQQGSVQLL